MCINHSDKKCCLNPEQRKNEHGKCSHEQIKKCHGDEKQHLCKDNKKKGCVK